MECESLDMYFLLNLGLRVQGLGFGEIGRRWGVEGESPEMYFLDFRA